VFVLRSSIRRLVPAPLKYLILRMLSEPTAIPLQYDSFLRSLQFVNPGMLHQGNIALFDHCISRLQSTAPLIEIGSFCGLSLNAIIYLLDKHYKPNEVFSVDAWHFEGAPNGTIGASNLPFPSIATTQSRRSAATSPYSAGIGFRATSPKTQTNFLPTGVDQGFLPISSGVQHNSVDRLQWPISMATQLCPVDAGLSQRRCFFKAGRVFRLR
jgi:hypothetical protein